MSVVLNLMLGNLPLLCVEFIVGSPTTSSVVLRVKRRVRSLLPRVFLWLQKVVIYLMTFEPIALWPPTVVRCDRERSRECEGFKLKLRGVLKSALVDFLARHTLAKALEGKS